jgi:hypothetical protein
MQPDAKSAVKNSFFMYTSHVAFRWKGKEFQKSSCRRAAGAIAALGRWVIS